MLLASAYAVGGRVIADGGGRGWTGGQVLSDWSLEGSDSKPQQTYFIHSDLRMSKYGRITTVLEMVAE